MENSPESVPWKILIVDTEEEDYLLAREMLSKTQRRKYTVDWAASYRSAQAAICSSAYDAVLIDDDLGDGQGLRLIHEATAAGCPAALILFTERSSYEVDMEAMQAGACLYLVKGETSALMLERGLRYAIERKLIEQALKRSGQELEASRIETENQKRRLEAVLAALPVGVVITDVQGNPLKINPAYEQIWGESPSQALAADDWAAYPAWWADTDKPVLPEDWASSRAIQEGETISGQILKIRRFDGKYSYVINSAAPVRDSDGKITGSAVSLQDISQLKQAETLNKALQEINQLLYSTLNFEALMQQAVSASCLALGCETAAISLRKNNHWQISYVHGFPEELIGTETNDDEELHACLVIQTQKPLAINNAFNDERVNREHMVKWGVRSVLVVPILLKGKTIGVIFFNHQTTNFEFQDVHLQFGVNLAASISLALENARLFSSLENEIRERKRAEKALAENAAHLEQSNQELEQYAFHASHDLQEPLRKIESFSSYLAEKAGPGLGETERDYLVRMQKAVIRMRKMINDLLALSQVTSQGKPFKPVDLNQIVLAVLDDLESQIQQTGGLIELGELPVIQADPTQMQRLFQNLIANALKFSKPSEPPRVRVSSCRLPEQWLEITVEDNGVGFDTKRAGRLFQPFQRLHGRSEYEGSGIGLSICRKITERHGGEIKAHSERGKGSIFTVRLPANNLE